MNKIRLNIIGRLGKDPEWKEIGGGLCKFSVAVSKNKKVNGEWEQETEWFDVNVWGEHGQRLMERLSKGDLVDVEGRFESREHNDKRYWTLTANAVLKLTKNEPSVAAAKVVDSDDDELPF